MEPIIEDLIHEKIVPRKIPFEIISFKELYDRHKNNLSHLTECKRLQFNALFIVLSGEAYHNIDCSEVHLLPGSVVPMVKEQLHFFAKELTIDGIIITFTDEFIMENTSERNLFHFLELYHNPLLQIDPENIGMIKPLISLLFKEQDARNDYLKPELLKTLFFSLLLQIKRLTPLDGKVSDYQHFKDFISFKKLISQEYGNTHNAKDYANELGVSYKYLNDISKELSGKTAKAFIDTWLVLEIKRKIFEKKYSLKEIAYQTGFEEPTNFIRFFKSHTGETPRHYYESLSLTKLL
jgi:AraC-like DNA-binding protein